MTVQSIRCECCDGVGIMPSLPEFVSIDRAAPQYKWEECALCDGTGRERVADGPQSMGDILENMARRGSLPPVIRAAISAGAALDKANEIFVDAQAREYWNKPFLLADLVTGSSMWPCDYSLSDLLAMTRVRMTGLDRKSLKYLHFQAAERTLGRMIEAEARLHVEGKVA